MGTQIGVSYRRSCQLADPKAGQCPQYRSQKPSWLSGRRMRPDTLVTICTHVSRISRRVGWIQTGIVDLVGPFPLPRFTLLNGTNTLICSLSTTLSAVFRSASTQTPVLWDEHQQPAGCKDDSYFSEHYFQPKLLSCPLWLLCGRSRTAARSEDSPER